MASSEDTASISVSISPSVSDPPSVSTPASPSTDDDYPRSLVRLPAEITDKILAQLALSDLFSVARVCRSLHEQAAPRLYRAISHTFYPSSAMDDLFSWQRFTSLIEQLLTSTHDYAQYVREITISSIDGSDVLGSPLYASRSPITSPGRQETLNYYLVQLLEKAVNLAIFRWDLDIELSPSLLLALERLNNLQSLHVRLTFGPISRRAYATSLSKVLENTRVNASMVPSASRILPLMSGLKALTILDIPSLDCIPEVAKCISYSSSTLKTLQLSFADILALKKSSFLPPLPNAAHHNDDQSLDFNDIFGPYSDDEEDEEEQPIVPEELRPTPGMLHQIAVQEEASAFLFDVGLSVPTDHKSVPHSNSTLTVHDSGPSSSTRVDPEASVGDSSASSVGPASLVLSGPSDARTSISSVSETAGASAKPNAKSIKEYVREAHGLPVEGLYLYQLPITASTLTSGVDLGAIRHLSLLNVGPQDDIWAAMNKRHAYTSYSLTSIHTDHVVPAFLEFVHNLPRLCELFILERSHRSTLVNTARTTATIADIRRFVLDKHTPHLERLVIRHDDTSAWDLDPSTATLLTTAPRLAELAVSVNSDSYAAVTHNIQNMTSLKALQFFWHNKSHSTAALRRELAIIADLVIRHPRLAIEYVGMGYIRAGPVTNCIVHVPARLAQLRDMKDGYVSDPEVSRRSDLGAGWQVLYNERPLMTVPDEVFARSGASGFDVEEIVGVKMWEPRTWNLKL